MFNKIKKKKTNLVNIIWLAIIIGTGGSGRRATNNITWNNNCVPYIHI